MPNLKQKAKKREERLEKANDELPLGQKLPGVMLEKLVEAHLLHVARLHKAKLPVSYSNEYFEEAVRNNRWSRVAKWDGIVVGAVLAKELEGGLRIQSIAAAIPRRGLGMRLLSAVVADADAAGIRKVSLHVHVRNEAAIALYTSLGFRTEITKIGYYNNSAANLEPPYDAQFMVRSKQHAAGGASAKLVAASAVLCSALLNAANSGQVFTGEDSDSVNVRDKIHADGKLQLNDLPASQSVNGQTIDLTDESLPTSNTKLGDSKPVIIGL